MRSARSIRSRQSARSAGAPTSQAARRAALIAALAAAACAPAPLPEDAARPAPGGHLGHPFVFMGSCDASGAASLGAGRIAVADDEDNHLRVYDLSTAGPPVEMVDTRAHLADERGKHPEMDLEAAATLGDRVYWIASHSRKKSGKRAQSRLRLFATDLQRGEDGAATLAPQVPPSLELKGLPAGPPQGAVAGRAYEQLLEDLVTAPALARFDLAAAAARPPNQPGGLNIEGLTDIPGTGHILLAFRSPVPGGRALLVPIHSPAAMVERADRPALAQR